jgi:integrative and conjugative element protein (TIGR02256 family)
VPAVVLGKESKCVKINLPNGKVVDVLNTVLDEISKWIQDDNMKPESGGYIVGYQHSESGNITLESVSHPFTLDIKSRVYFGIRDPRHKLFLRRSKKNKSYYMGVWHTHPQNVPIPSSIDWDDWKKTLQTDRTGSEYVFYIIAGTEQWRMWVGNMASGEIVEGVECHKNSEGFYLKSDEGNNEENN